jgi:hypothetical protein
MSVELHPHTPALHAAFVSAHAVVHAIAASGPQWWGSLWPSTQRGIWLAQEMKPPQSHAVPTHVPTPQLIPHPPQFASLSV